MIFKINLKLGVFFYEVKMEKFLVGGAVRDKLLNLDIKDQDWVIVGGNPQYFLDKGFQQVGKDFPVFLDPNNKEEYALARIERKIGNGYRGFETDFNPNITLEEDLSRRDLTINAMAMDSHQKIIDPFNGQEDLKNRVIRHVSDAFKEDPVRILRVARFMARYESFGFTIADETMKIMKEMVKNGEVNNLVPERVFQEMDKTFSEEKPSVFFQTLKDCGALAVIFPEIDIMEGIPQPLIHHPEGCVFTHTKMVVDQARRRTTDKAVIYSALVHDLGKGITPKDILPSHHSHEIKGVPLVETMSDRLNVPKEYKKLGMISSKNHLLSHTLKDLKPRRIFELIEEFDIFRKPKFIQQFLTVCESDAAGRTGRENQPYPQREYMMGCVEAIKSVSAKDVVALGFKGKEIGEKLKELQYGAMFKHIKLLPENYSLIYESNKDLFTDFSNIDNKKKIKLILNINKESQDLLTIMLDNYNSPNKNVINEINEGIKKVRGEDIVAEGFKNYQIGIEMDIRRIDIAEEIMLKYNKKNKINKHRSKP
jgi:tRNA nucleotidyltransferase (CCA-adding enzyme)